MISISRGVSRNLQGATMSAHKHPFVVKSSSVVAGFVAAVVGAVLLVAPGSARATEYFVAPTGSDSNPGTMASPFATIQKGHNVAVAGDTVWLRAGTYKNTSQIKLSTQRNVRYRAHQVLGVSERDAGPGLLVVRLDQQGGRRAVHRDHRQLVAPARARDRERPGRRRRAITRSRSCAPTAPATTRSSCSTSTTDSAPACSSPMEPAAT